MKRSLILLCISFMLLTAVAPVFAAGENPTADKRNQLIAYASDALISAREKNWEHASTAVSKIKEVWSSTASTASADSSKDSKAVVEALTKAEQQLSRAGNDENSAYQAVSALAKAIDSYATDEAGDVSKDKAHKQIQALLPMLSKSLSAVKAGEALQAKQSFNSFNSGWAKAENLIRQENAAFYGTIEVKISGARIALNTEPMDAEKSSVKLQELIAVLEDYLAGKAAAATASSSSGSVPTVSSLMQLLDSISADVQNKQSADAADKMDTFIAAWPSIEGEVMTRSSQAYSRIEKKIVTIPSLLLSNPPQFDQANILIGELKKELEPYAQSSSYSAWDAGVILFREGLEAILVIAALIAFLNRSGNADKRKWVWSGAVTGVAASAALALVLSVLLSNLSTGNSRELIEGITGLIAVVFMITIGAWLHNKSNLRAWNAFIEKTIGASLAKGTLWSLALTAFLSVMREGAETLIFYIGMAPTIQKADLLLGIGTASLLLAVIGYAIIKMSARIPIRPFFLTASLLLYYLAFKFIGVSIHALQVTGKLPAHVSGYLIDAPGAGIYANWETTIPQLVVLLIVLWNFFRIERNKGIAPNRNTVKI